MIDIFCDESGFTGQNLLNPDQRFFAYGSVAISHTEADALVSHTIREFRLQGRELKGKNLTKYPSGRRAALSIIKAIGTRSQVVVVDKHYALACKLYEYTFEPLISDISTAFYNVNFHKFIGNLIHILSIAGHERARELAQRFEKAMRGDTEPLAGLLSVHSAKGTDPLEALISFCVYHRDDILRELEEAKAAVPWILDVTGTALNSLLTAWGRRADQLRVVCDESGPLADGASYFDVWVGREDKRTFYLGGRQVDLGFNLVAPIALGKSHDYPGIQLADVLAAVTVAAFSDPSASWAEEVKDVLFRSEAINPDSILPEADRLDLELPATQLNVLILLELLERSEQGLSLTAGMVDYIIGMSEAIRSNPPLG